MKKIIRLGFCFDVLHCCWKIFGIVDCAVYFWNGYGLGMEKI